MNVTQPYTIPKMKRTKFIAKERTYQHSKAGSGEPVGPVKQKSSFSTGQIDETKLPTHYTFFKENKTEKPFKLSIEELKKRYIAFLKTKDIKWVLYYGHQTVVVFVTSKEGLNSSIEMNDYIKLEMALTKTRHTLYPDQKKKTKLKRTR